MPLCSPHPRSVALAGEPAVAIYDISPLETKDQQITITPQRKTRKDSIFRIHRFMKSCEQSMQFFDQISLTPARSDSMHNNPTPSECLIHARLIVKNQLPDPAPTGSSIPSTPPSLSENPDISLGNFPFLHSREPPPCTDFHRSSRQFPESTDLTS